MDIMQLLQKISTGVKRQSAGPVFDAVFAGLGNPGAKYLNTRHNVGFMFIDALAKEYHAADERKKFQSLCSEITVCGRRLLLLKPQTFMNVSGEAVREAVSFYKLPLEQTYIVFDDISLETGKLRFRKEGSAGGHNGVKSMIQCFGSEVFPRIKIGVGNKPHSDYDLARWVLSSPDDKDRDKINAAVHRAVSSVPFLIKGEFDYAASKFSK